MADEFKKKECPSCTSEVVYARRLPDMCPICEFVLNDSLKGRVSKEGSCPKCRKSIKYIERLPDVCPHCGEFIESDQKSSLRVVCPKCGKIQADSNAVYCMSCGASLDGDKPEPDLERVCPKCGKVQADKSARFCMECGYSLEKKKDKSAAETVCVLSKKEKLSVVFSSVLSFIVGSGFLMLLFSLVSLLVHGSVDTVTVGVDAVICVVASALFITVGVFSLFRRRWTQNALLVLHIAAAVWLFAFSLIVIAFSLNVNAGFSIALAVVCIIGVIATRVSYKVLSKQGAEIRLTWINKPTKERPEKEWECPECSTRNSSADLKCRSCGRSYGKGIKKEYILLKSEKVCLAAAYAGSLILGSYPLLSYMLDPWGMWLNLSDSLVATLVYILLYTGFVIFGTFSLLRKRWASVTLIVLCGIYVAVSAFNGFRGFGIVNIIVLVTACFSQKAVSVRVQKARLESALASTAEGSGK